jgi:hypothetical protein
MKTNRKRGGGFLKVFCAVVAALIFVFVILPAGCSALATGCAVKEIKDESARQDRARPDQTEPKRKH